MGLKANLSQKAMLKVRGVEFKGSRSFFIRQGWLSKKAVNYNTVMFTHVFTIRQDLLKV